MAVRIVHTIIDDLDGSTTDVATYRFAYDGVDYQIDLSDPNIDKLRAALYPFIAAARRLPRTATSPQRQQRRRADTAAIRAWWATHQHTGQLPPITPRGRIPVEVHAAYRRATT